VLRELTARCGGHSNWTLVPTAIGSAAGIVPLYDRSWHGVAGLHREWSDAPVTATRHVPILPLDAAVQCFGTPDYCKIDVEGWEYEVLEGLSSPVRLISFEFHLSEREINKTLRCFESLSRFGPATVNLTPADENAFFLKEWMAMKDFAALVAADAQTLLEAAPYGDIWVRLD
jgi:FkbM family methyltransferase